MHPWLERLRRLPFPERLILGALLLLAAAVWAFVKIAGEVVAGDTQHFDEAILLALRRPGDPAHPLGPDWLLEMARDVTAFGGVVGIALVSGGVLGFLALARKWRAAALVLASVVGGLLVSVALKHSFDRDRPGVVPHFDQVYTSSFPSGHSMLSAVTYLTLGALLARYTHDRLLKIYFLGIATGLSFIIGLSRIYLGVHYPTDVLAGWCAGIAWALLCAVVARWLQRRGEVETETFSPGS
jgi:undecaprenyl-diphosphatase